MDFIRADRLLTHRGVTESRSQAAEYIRNGWVTIDGKPVSKPSTLVLRSGHVALDLPVDSFVSRGGMKLSGALDAFHIDVEGKTALDCGASTGGLTDCLLKAGARKVYAIDVGYGQLHWKLRQDPRVVVMERINLRHLDPTSIPDRIQLITLDMSFISLTLIFDILIGLLDDCGEIIALIKPQFEAGRDAVGSGGVVRDGRVHEQVLRSLATHVSENGWRLRGMVPSPLLGPSGNREFFFHLDRGDPTDPERYEPWIRTCVEA